MRALCWNGINDLRVETVPDPVIMNPNDAIIRVVMSSVCGADLHLIDGFVPSMRPGDILGHEFIGEVVETGSSVKQLRRGDHVVVGPVIGCGECSYCRHGSWSLCDNTNPNALMQEKLYGASSAGILGYSHAFGGYAGSHATYVRVPFADKGAFLIPEGLRDEQVIFASDAFPTGYMAADMADIRPGDSVAVWGCGGVGLMAIQSAFLLGAGRVIGIDRIPDRLRKASEMAGAEVLNYEKTDIHEALKEMTGGRGPDRCIDAVGMEGHSPGIDFIYDKVKQTLRMETDRPVVLREAIRACRKGGTVSIVGVYGGLMDKFPMGAALNKGLTLRMGQMHTQKYIPVLLDHITKGRVDPSYLLTHRLSLELGPQGYEMFKKKKDKCLRVVFSPN